MSLIAMVVLALALAVPRRVVRLAFRIALLIALIELAVSYGTHAVHNAKREPPVAPASQRHQPNRSLTRRN